MMLKLTLVVVLLGVVAAKSSWQCRRLTKTDCSKKDARPVCGNDGVTYNNTCFFDQAECKSDDKMWIVFRGDCDDKPTIPPPVDVCSKEYKAKNVKCNDKSRAQCGSDGKTYTNWCEFHEARCADVAKFGKKDAPKVGIKVFGKTCEELPTRPSRLSPCNYWLKTDCSKQRINKFSRMCDKQQNVYSNRCFFTQAYCKNKTIRRGICKRPRPTKPTDGSGSGEVAIF